jgi:hypothetical protein
VSGMGRCLRLVFAFDFEFSQGRRKVAEKKCLN